MPMREAVKMGLKDFMGKFEFKAEANGNNLNKQKVNVLKALKELKMQVTTIVVIDSFIDFLLAFLIIYFAFMFVPVNNLFSLIPASVFFIYRLFINIRKVNYADVESKVPILKEELRTAADNLNKDNEIIRMLCEDVITKMKAIKNSYFINFRKIQKNFLVITILCFAIVGITSLNLQAEVVEKAANLAKKANYGDIKAGLTEREGEGGIFGEKSLAELGKNNLDIKINPVESDIDINNVEDIKDRSFNKQYAAEIEASTDKSYDGNIPKEHQEIVMRYFKEVVDKEK